jgi:hypothetical protein
MSRSGKYHGAYASGAHDSTTKFSSFKGRSADDFDEPDAYTAANDSQQALDSDYARKQVVMESNIDKYAQELTGLLRSGPGSKQEKQTARARLAKAVLDYEHNQAAHELAQLLLTTDA